MTDLDDIKAFVARGAAAQKAVDEILRGEKGKEDSPQPLGQKHTPAGAPEGRAAGGPRRSRGKRR